MVTVYYGFVYGLSLLCSAIYIYKCNKRVNVNVSMLFAFIPIACLGYYLLSTAQSLGEAVNAIKIMYLGGTFLQLFIFLSITNLCQININNVVKLLLAGACCICYTFVLTIGKNDMFYKNLSFELVDGFGVLKRGYGSMHTYYYLFVIVFFLAGLTVIYYSWKNKRQVSRRIIILLFIPDCIVVIGYLFGRKIINEVELIPIGYLLAQVIYLIIAERMNMYDVDDTAVDSMVQGQSIGYITFDYDYRYLGSNESAKKIIPELNNIAVDSRLTDSQVEKQLYEYIDLFKNNPQKNSFVYTFKSKSGRTNEDLIYNVTVNNMYYGNSKIGYSLTLVDDTANRQYIKLLDNYKDKLKTEVDEKTKHIVLMHDNLIMSLAMMVESRDNSTGGHIKRTSEVVRILIDEIIREGKLPLTKKFCEDVVKAAPMHDLGKIAVDDVVLRKPGKFTDEEYEKMKEHAKEGARVIHEVLLTTDDKSFKKVAENVAHFHHERYDGSGYPDKLSGEQIPIEARIMAIADVYDALVSKRVYKEAFTFEKANSIILEGMGTQFDPGLRSAYEKARPRLEKYYMELQ